MTDLSLINRLSLDMKIPQIKPGDLLEIVAYDINAIDGPGLVSPWGFRPEALDIVKEISSSSFRRITRTPKNFVPLKGGESCIAITVAAVIHPTIDAYCIVLVDGMRLCVNLRFLKKI